jgi:hypothetical protein
MTSPLRREGVDHAIDTQDGGREIVAARQAVERARKWVLSLNADPPAAAERHIDPWYESAPPPTDAAHARAITEALDDARRRAGRPFGRRAAKQVVALELAERLATGNIGLPPEPERSEAYIDLTAIERARAELHDAEADLEELMSDQESLPRRPRPWRPVTLPAD